MTTQQQFFFLGFLGLLVSAASIHWLITPTSHPDATTARTIGVYAEFFAAIALAVWAFRRSRRLARTS